VNKWAVDAAYLTTQWLHMGRNRHVSFSRHFHDMATV
jgi:hypothetical protein